MVPRVVAAAVGTLALAVVLLAGLVALVLLVLLVVVQVLPVEQAMALVVLPPALAAVDRATLLAAALVLVALTVPALAIALERRRSVQTGAKR
jgi:hypothetical protein